MGVGLGMAVAAGNTTITGAGGDERSTLTHDNIAAAIASSPTSHPRPPFRINYAQSAL